MSAETGFAFDLTGSINYTEQVIQKSETEDPIRNKDSLSSPLLNGKPACLGGILSSLLSTQQNRLDPGSPMSIWRNDTRLRITQSLQTCLVTKFSLCLASVCINQGDAVLYSLTNKNSTETEGPPTAIIQPSVRVERDLGMSWSQLSMNVFQDWVSADLLACACQGHLGSLHTSWPFTTCSMNASVP